ncbi:MAG: MoxR family ATPase [Vagococcus sp.]|uniref:AAA family ATPase n=1 Tax=Vagococcus sp. TaxID=1933889 RepID=UPI002FC802C8
MNKKANEILTEVKKNVRGKDDIIEKVLISILAKGHVLLEDVPGVGKTTMALSFSRVMDLDFKRIQFTPDVTPSDVIGFTMYDVKAEKFVFKTGAVMSNLVLADEINRTSSKTQSALLEVMEEHQVTVDGQTYKVPEPFFVIGTQNPIGSAGTQMLPNSQLDRFMMCLEIGYPSKESLVDILRDRQSSKPLEKLNKIVTKEELMTMQEDVMKITIHDDILMYIAELCEATRHHEMIELGLSPRGALSISLLAKSRAYVSGRDFVTPEDVLAIFPDAAAHRLILKNTARLANQHARLIVEQITKEVKTGLAKEVDKNA